MNSATVKQHNSEILNYDTKNHILLGEHGIKNVQAMNCMGTFPGQSEPFSVEKFKKEVKIKIISCSKGDAFNTDKIKSEEDKELLPNESRKDMDIEFDMINIDAALANAYRRILMSEVPTMAIEKVYLYQNTSIIQDEVLCHRLGLIPIKVDPRNFNYRTVKTECQCCNYDESPNFKCGYESRIHDTIRFQLHVKSSWKEGMKEYAMKQAGQTTGKSSKYGAKLLGNVKDKTDRELFDHSHVYSKDLIWVPLNDEQREMFKDNPPRPVHSDILLARLRPGQEIKLVVDCVKGVGSDHAKFSPVATATYRLHPTIELKQEISGKSAEKLQACFPPGVIDVNRKTGIASVGANLRNDVISREVYRHDDLKDIVQLGRLKEHFIFTIESTGALDAKTLFMMATQILIEKCTYMEKELNKKEEEDEDFEKEEEGEKLEEIKEEVMDDGDN